MTKVYCRDCEHEFMLDDSEGERMSQDINGDWNVACPEDENCPDVQEAERKAQDEHDAFCEQRNEDERLDDPRHGQAEWINRQGRRES